MLLAVAASTSGSRQRAQSMARDWLPPAVLRAARRVRAPRPGTGGSAATAAAGHAAGDERGPDFYDATFDNSDRWKQPYWEMQWFGSWSIIADRIVTASSNGSAPSVLDMGCGAGHLSALLRDRGVAHIVGFDFSPKRVEFAREQVSGVEFHLADAYTTELLDADNYDVVVTTEFLEHVDGDLTILGRLRPGVRVLGTVPDYDDTGHVRYFPTHESVTTRYADVLDGLRVDRLRNTTGTSLWLLDGTTH
jgi:SAM-dependent methyltransferase